jgi:farnesyl-diphosphate farnesyltransferase
VVDAFVAQHLQGVSRTYAILIPMLPGGLADAVGVAYLLMRIVDTLEDDPRLSPSERLRHLSLLEAALDADAGCAPDTAAVGCVPGRTLHGLGVSKDERELMHATPEVFARVDALDPEYRAPVCACARAMSAGVRRLIVRSAERRLPYPAVRDAAELREYCYYVAGVVGEMLCAVMAHFLRLPALLRLQDVAVELGIGLQLVNILKDALQDSQQGRRYLPLAAGGAVAHAEIYTAVLQEARQSLRRGIEFVVALPASARELRSFCGLPIAWGAMTLARAERDASAAKIDREAVRTSIEHFRLIAGDDRAVREWLGGMLRPSPVAT